MKRFIICFIACTQFSHGEDVTLVVKNTANQTGMSQAIILNQGDSAKMIFAGGRADGGSLSLFLVCNIQSMTFELSALVPVAAGNSITITGPNPIAIAGPASIALRSGYSSSVASSGFATFSITRSGIASPPAAIPQEADTKWDVILESSSDLVNWTPANPGEYSGTEPKRFFRTRMVKKP